MVESIATKNGGRSCLNASTIVVPAHAPEIAGSLAERLGPVGPRPINDESAVLAGFPNPKVAEVYQRSDRRGPANPRRRRGDGKVSRGAATDHAQWRGLPATNNRALRLLCAPIGKLGVSFPCTPVSSKCLQTKMAESIGPSLVVTAITRDEPLIEQLMESPHIRRLNIGPLATMQVAWDQPHEGNLFELLYKEKSDSAG